MKKGFTLIELLIVVAIIGILAAVGAAVIPGLLDNTKRNTADMLCKQIITEVKSSWTACQFGVPLYLRNSGSGVVDRSADWCTFNSANPAKTDMRAQAFVGHYGTHSQTGSIWGPRNPYRTNA